MGKSKHEGKSRYKRDWSKYDENVITRYELMFPLLRLPTLVGITGRGE
jgi:hypothetical protein